MPQLRGNEPILGLNIYQQEIDDDQAKEAKKEETIEDTSQESTMFLWDRCIDSDEE
jgi:hypothetical protein